jgi:diguanylate cyclase (GGDEF)-like protein
LKNLLPPPGNRGLDIRLRAKLVASLYTRPISLFLGAICGIFSSTAAALSSDEPALTWAAVILAAVGLWRSGIAVYFGRDAEKRDARKLEILYEIGAFAFAGMTGLIAAMTILLDVHPHAELLTVAFAIALATGTAVRNAGRPMIAIGQLVLALLPVTIAAAIYFTPLMLAFAVTMALLIPTTISITFTFFKVYKESVLAGETSAQLAEKMRLLARTDAVTGLDNRNGLNHDALQMIVDRPERCKLAMLWLDLDKFKEVNDTLGHPVGDRVLSEIGKRLRATAPDTACVARFGGDEFILLAQVADRAESERLARSISEQAARPIRIDGRRIDTGASMGVALLPDDGQDLDTLMQGADLALYHAKVAGRGQICFFDTSMTRDLVRKKEIETELRAAIQRDELSIFFQPIVDLETGRIRAFEALVRWFHPEKGELRPDEFIPVAEETGVIITLGNWITAQAAKTAATWPDDVTVAVNLSPLQIRAPGAALGILTALRDAGLDPHRLELEVTESLFLDNNENTGRFMEELAAVGVRFALDDFGTGYSSLGYINTFPFKKIKVDRSFVSGPNIGRKSDAIIRAVAEMGSTLDMDIVAEGLETIEQVQAVRNAGCTLGQGYYFSRAVPDYLAAMLLARERERDELTLKAAG